MADDKSNNQEINSNSSDNDDSRKRRRKRRKLKSSRLHHASHIFDALHHVETIGQTISNALQTRGNVVMVRVNDETLRHLDMLVEAEITKSRSESAAYLINEGIKSQKEFFEKIGEVTSQIEKLRTQLRNTIKSEE